MKCKLLATNKFIHALVVIIKLYHLAGPLCPIGCLCPLYWEVVVFCYYPVDLLCCVDRLCHLLDESPLVFTQVPRLCNRLCCRNSLYESFGVDFAARILFALRFIPFAYDPSPTQRVCERMPGLREIYRRNPAAPHAGASRVRAACVAPVDGPACPSQMFLF